MYSIPDSASASSAESSPRILKRARSTSLPLTPPLTLNDPDGTQRLDRAVNVLSTAATALSQVTILYQSSAIARDGLLKAVDCISRVHGAGGKLILCGVGKSGLVAKKLVATMKSLGIGSSFLHPSEALHGDLGDVRPNDAVLLISYSGKTPELLHLLDHIPETTPILAITAHTDAADCPLLHDRPDAILLPAPIHELEEVSFGVCAPTTSTTVAIAVGDMVALTVAESLHEHGTKQVFKKNHPGGAIGDKARQAERAIVGKETQMKRHKGLPSPA